MRAIFDFRSTLPNADMTGATAAANKTKGSRTWRPKSQAKGDPRCHYDHHHRQDKRTHGPYRAQAAPFPPLPMLSLPRGNRCLRIGTALGSGYAERIFYIDCSRSKFIHQTCNEYGKPELGAAWLELSQVSRIPDASIPVLSTT